MNQIQQIEVGRLLPHPKNPRKNLGDLTELAKSIAAKGIMQNLTITPVDIDEYNKMVSSKREYTGDYYILIGHRRAAAAKLTELETVPCAVVDMSDKEEISTMLLENMQRENLTPLEEAQGIQMMMDLGDTVSTISEVTGFSATKIKNRLRLNGYDPDVVEKSFERGGTFEDYAKLEKIQDPEKRAKIAKEIGTSNFDWSVRKEIAAEKLAEKKPAVLAALNEFAERVKKVQGGYEFIANIHFEHGEVKKPADADKRKYIYSCNDYGACLYRECKEKRVSKKETERKAAIARITELHERAYERRVEFALKFTAFKSHFEDIINLAARAVFERCYNKSLMKLLNVDLKSWELRYENIIEKLPDEKPVRILFLESYTRMDSGGCVRTDGVYYEDKNLEFVYALFCSFGYEMSDEERALMDGTHELYVREDEE